MSRDGRPVVPLLLVRLAALLVPADRRRDWVREWEAELLGRWSDGRRAGAGAGEPLGLVRRALGSFVDASRLRVRHGALRGLGHDARIALRSLLRRPTFSVLVVATLALGIGANATLFSVARDQLLRPFPYPDAERVVAVVGTQDGRRSFSGNVTYPNLADLGEKSTTLSDIGLIRYWFPALTGAGEAIVLRGGTVTSNYFRILGMEPGVGRYFAPEEQGTGRDPQVVLSHGFWQAHFGGDPQVVGTDVLLNGTAYRVIGITSSDFEDPWLLGGANQEPQIWRTVASPPSEWPRSGRSWNGIARIRTGVAQSVAQSEISALMQGLAEAYPDHNAGRGMELVPLRDRVVGPVRSAILILMTAVSVLLLVAIANLASLLLGRALERRREFAVVRALGASRWRIVRNGLLEAGILALAGGASGLAVTVMFIDGVRRQSATFLPRPMEGGVDLGVVGFAALAALGSGLLFGLVPALHAANTAGTPGREDGRGATAGQSGSRLRRGLVVLQVALTTVLLVGSGLLGRSLQRLGQVDLGLQTEGVLAMTLHGSAWFDLSEGEGQAQWDAIMESISGAAGVASVGAIDYVPLAGDYSCDGVTRTDLPPPGPGEDQCGEVRVILPGALETLDIPLVRGRHIGPQDNARSPGVVVIDQSMAEALWPGEDPIGRTIRVHTNEHQVVGIVEDMMDFGPGVARRPMLYLPAPQEGWNGVARGLSVLVRGTRDAQALAGAVRGAIHDVNPAVAIGTVTTLDQLLGQTLQAPRFRALLLGLFAGSALLLSLMGIVGVMAFSVARRTREMGVRLALGARPGEVRSLVLAEGIRLTVVGALLGALVSLGASPALEAVLFEVTARDPMTFVAVLAVILSAGISSCYLPARRASSVDPVLALSAE